MADVRINQLPDFSNFGEIGLNDLVAIKMVGANKTVKVPLSELAALLSTQGSTAIETPTLSLVVTGNDQINLSWNSVANSTEYKVYRSLTGNFNDAVLITTTSGLLFNDTGRQTATTYRYWLQATGSGFVNSGYSFGSATTTGTGADVTAPFLISAIINNAAPNKIVLTYNELLLSSSNATTTQFTVSGGRIISQVEITGSTVVITVNTNFNAGEVITVSYTGNQVKDISGNLAPTFTNTAVTNNVTGGAIQLAAPFLAAVPNQPNGQTEVKLTWNDVASESNYEVEVTLDFTTWTAVTMPAANAVQYIHTGRIGATFYTYRIRAVGNGTTTLTSLWSTAGVTTEGANPATYDTVFANFSPFYSKKSAAGVTVIVHPINAPSCKFEFNAIASRTLAPATMTIKKGSEGRAQVDFPQDYIGKPFRWTDHQGVVNIALFVNGTITF